MEIFSLLKKNHVAFLGNTCQDDNIWPKSFYAIKQYLEKISDRS